MLYLDNVSYFLHAVKRLKIVIEMKNFFINKNKREHFYHVCKYF